MGIESKKIVLIGYSGHSLVVADLLQLQGYDVYGYCDKTQKVYNPLSLKYLGAESEIDSTTLEGTSVFPSIGDNFIREKVFISLLERNAHFVNAIHPKAIVSASVKLGTAVMIAGGATINPFSKIGNGAICNTNSSIDHECTIGNFTHIGPGANICGNVTIGERTFIGAGAIVKQGIRIGADCIIGAGAVVLKDVENGSKLVGNPARNIASK